MSDDLTWREYVERTRRTAHSFDSVPPRLQFAQAALGISAELRELADARPGQRTDEAGDVCWYVALAERSLEHMLEDYEIGLSLRDSDPVEAFRRMESSMATSQELAGFAEGVAFQGDKPESLYGPSIKHKLELAIEAAREFAPDSLPDVWRNNLDKLDARHPDGHPAEGEIDLP